MSATTAAAGAAAAAALAEDDRRKRISRGEEDPFKDKTSKKTKVILLVILGIAVTIGLISLIF